MRGRHLGLGVFEPGRHGDARRLHAAGPRSKGLGLFLVAIAASLVWRQPDPLVSLASATTLAAGSVGLAAWAGFGARTLLAWLAPSVWIVLALAVARLVGEPLSPAAWAITAAQALCVASVILLARLFVATTKTSDLVEAITHDMEPLRPLGARPEVFALTVALVIRSIPMLGGAASAVRDAHAARGLKPRPRSVVAPVAMTAVATTIATSEALTARMLPRDAHREAPETPDTPHEGPS
ncbi:energy-coupling factor transporter transmembrane component T [Falsarthrobacter nasiphocae]|uniref:Biotin transport system permease protein n=1 Tax=Falsarthrobacter nasiphocae TaxID=189863 RepID=A0AAE4C497_9MICC|nr:energy-coupling factor transporter transmembrane component T [Falsarthrobacter nasiphocae]MDR6891141.1 biotin transport system permease protein [Falsarthrobacter nasiphocae]